MSNMHRPEFRPPTPDESAPDGEQEQMEIFQCHTLYIYYFKLIINNINNSVGLQDHYSAYNQHELQR